MKRVCQWMMVVLAFFSLAACHKKEAEPTSGLKIVTSFYPIYAMTKAVSGDLNDVKMIQSSRGIHSFEPSASDIQAIYDADIFVYHSHVLEAWAGRLQPSGEDSVVQIVEASKGLPLQRVEGLEDIEVAEGVDDATLYDPHTWLDPVLVGEETRLIAEQLSEIDPEHKAIYQKNAEKMVEEMQQLTDKYAAIFKKCEDTTFVTQHTAFAYTASRFGLKQLGISGVSEQEPSPRQLAEIKEFIEEYQVKTIFVEKGTSDKLAKSLATSTGVQVKVLEPLEADPANGKSLVQNLDDNLSVLAKDLVARKNKK